MIYERDRGPVRALGTFKRLGVCWMRFSSLFKSILRHEDPSEGEPEDQAEEEEDEPELDMPDFNRGMPVEVLRDFETVLFAGRLGRVTLGELTIERIPGEISLVALEAGSPVLVRGYDGRMNPIILCARVIRSSVVECVIGDIEIDRYANQRKDTRYPLSVSANAYLMRDTLLDNPQPCQVLNISPSGAYIVSEYVYPVGQDLRLRVELVENSGFTSYCSQVVRVAPRQDGAFEYGLLFAQLDKRKLKDLMRDIEDIQKETERKMLS